MALPPARQLPIDDSRLNAGDAVDEPAQDGIGDGETRAAYLASEIAEAERLFTTRSVTEVQEGRSFTTHSVMQHPLTQSSEAPIGVFRSPRALGQGRRPEFGDKVAQRAGHRHPRVTPREPPDDASTFLLKYCLVFCNCACAPM